MINTFFVTHASILTSGATIKHTSLTERRTEHPATLLIKRIKSSVLQKTCETLLNFRCKESKPVSNYAFIKRWLLLSPRPGCLHFFTSFYLYVLKAFRKQSGLFPFKRRTLAPYVCLFSPQQSFQALFTRHEAKTSFNTLFTVV